MTFTKNIRIDLDRFWKMIESSAEIGKGRPGGLSRVALSDSDREMRDLFREWCIEAGLSVTVDAVGNIFGRREGLDPTLPPVLIGSHLDTQINGGRFDGIAGVMAALEVCRTLNDAGYDTRRAIEIVSWTNEEGARFSPPMVASGCFVGAYTTQWVYDLEADDGARFGTELERIGYRGDRPCDQPEIDAYLELHIEQGPILHVQGQEVGVVTYGFPSHGMMAEFSGETAHTGPWPMELRKNALAAGARWLTAVDDIGWEFAGTGGKGTAARLTAWPNKAGILSDHATAVCDVRHSEETASKVMAEKMRRALFEAAAKGGCDVKILDEWHWGGDVFDAALVSRVRHHADTLGYKWIDIASQAGHDAYFMARHCPTAMIFTPCKDGITHNNNESCEASDFEAGINVLLHTAVERADR